MDNQHAASCNFLLKLMQALNYLGLDFDAGDKKKYNFQGRHSYAQNRDFLHSLQDSGFIPYSMASADSFVDVVDNDHDVYAPSSFKISRSDKQVTHYGPHWLHNAFMLLTQPSPHYTMRRGMRHVIPHRR